MMFGRSEGMGRTEEGGDRRAAAAAAASNDFPLLFPFLRLSQSGVGTTLPPISTWLPSIRAVAACLPPPHSPLIPLLPFGFTGISHLPAILAGTNVAEVTGIECT